MSSVLDHTSLKPILLRRTLALMAFYVLCMVGLALWLDRSSKGSDSLYTKETVELLAQEKASQLAEAVWVSEWAPAPIGQDQLEKEIRSVLAQSDVITSITVVDSLGRVKAGSRDPRGSMREAPLDVFRGLERPQTITLPTLDGAPNQERVLLCPLMRGDKLAGYVRMTFQVARIHGIMHGVGRKLNLQILVGMIFIGIVTLLMQTGLSREAAELSRVLDAAVDATPVSIPEKGDEFVAVYKSAERVRLALSDARVERARAGERMAAISNAVNVGLLWFHPNGELDFANGRALEILGTESLERLRPEWRATFAPAAAALEDLGRSRAARGELVGVSLENPSRRLSFQISRIGGEECKGFVAVVTDREVVEMLEGDVHLAGQMQSFLRIIRTVMHELRSPLSAIIVNMDLLQDTLGKHGAAESNLMETQGKYINVVKKELNRLKQSLFEMLTKVVPNVDKMERLDLRGLVTDLAALVREQARRQGVEVDVHVPDRPMTVIGQGDRLRQAFLNLVVNALEAMPGGGRLRLILEPQGSRAMLQVRDSGPGLSTEQLSKIYEMGYTTKAAGTGIGLYVARALVEQHGGELRAWSNSGDGAVFEVELPLTRQLAEANCHTS